MPAKGTTGGSLGACEITPVGRKRQREWAKRFDARCKRLSGPVTVRKMTPEEMERYRVRKPKVE